MKMPSDIIHEGWITSAQAAEILGVTITYIHRLVETGGLPEGRRIAGAERVTFFRIEDVEKYLDAHPAVGTRRPVNRFKESLRPYEDRFWSKVEKSSEPEGCWLWIGDIRPNGYGDFFTKDRPHVSPHRFSWELHNGPIPDDMEICHRCDVRNCVRPDHLFLGTQADNIRDASRKGRMPHGENNAAAKLTERQVIEIRRRHKGGETHLSLASAFSVSSSCIGDIVNNRHWKQVKPRPGARRAVNRQSA